MCRRLVITALAATLACSADKVGPPPNPPVNWSSFEAHAAISDAGTVTATERERGLAVAYAKALSGSGLGFTGLGPLLDENAHIAFGRGADAHGRDKVLKQHDKLFGAFDQRVFTANRVVVTDSTQSIEWTMTGVHARDWMGVSASHKSASIVGVTLIWTQDDGTITDIHVLFDVSAVRAELAAATTPPATASETPVVVEQTRSADEASNTKLVGDWLVTLELDRRDDELLEATLAGKNDAGKDLRAKPRDDEGDFLAALTDDVEILTHGSTLRGKDAARGQFRAIRKSIGQLDVTLFSALAASSLVVVEYTIGGELRGPIGAVPFTHERVVMFGIVDVVEVRNGKVARVKRYDNPDELAAVAMP